MRQAENHLMKQTSHYEGELLRYLVYVSAIFSGHFLWTVNIPKTDWRISEVPTEKQITLAIVTFLDLRSIVEKFLGSKFN